MSNYVLINGELYHFGIPGMKWGVRKARYTSSRAKRRKSLDGAESVKKKAPKTEEELASELRRKRLENDLKAEKARGKSLTTPRQTKSANQEPPKKKPISEMTDEELQAAINRKMLEQRYRELNPKQVSTGQKFAQSVAKNVVKPVAEDIGRQMLKSLIVPYINEKAKTNEDTKIYTNNKKK